jgi:protein involved in ribonucleotide reduction
LTWNAVFSSARKGASGPFYRRVRFFYQICMGDGRRSRRMLIAYDSKTGNVRRFIEKLKLPAVQIEDTMILDEPFVLVTYTTGFGQVPAKVMSFLKRNHPRLKGVSASGNRNWGESFARSADRIAEMYGVPVLGKFELSGTQRDVDNFRQGVMAVAAY